MRRRPALVMSGIAAAVLGTVLAAPSSARLVRAETLGSVTTITATHSGTAEVVLYDDATLSPKMTGNPDVSISGKGRVVGVQLTRSDGTSDSLQAFRMPAFAGSQIETGGSTTPAPICTRDVTGGSSCTTPTPKAILLHEGYYHLVVLTDGAPVTVTLRLHGLSSAAARVHTQRDFRSVELSLPERESMGSTTVTYGGAQAGTGATAVSMLVAAKLHSSAAFRGLTVCSRADNGAPPPYAYSPACPGGSDEGYAYRTGGPIPAPVGGVGGIFLVGLPLPNASTGVGGSFIDSDGPTYVGGVGLWVWGENVNLYGIPLSSLG